MEKGKENNTRGNGLYQKDLERFCLMDGNLFLKSIRCIYLGFK